MNVKNPGNVLLNSVDRAQPVPVGFDAYFPFSGAADEARVQGYDFQAAVGRALARYGGSGFGLRSKLTGSAESKATVAHLRALLEAHDIDAAYGTVDMAMAWRTPTSWSNPHLDAAWQAGVRPLKPDSRLCGILRAECGPYYTKSAIR